MDIDKDGTVYDDGDGYWDVEEEQVDAEDDDEDDEEDDCEEDGGMI